MTSPAEAVADKEKAVRTLAGVILAGGRSSRMDGRNKVLLTLGGTTLIENAINRLAPQVSKLVISANDNLAPFHSGAIEIIADTDDSRPGPLAGILAGLRWAAMQPAPPQALISVAVDTPFFPYDLAAQLAAATNEKPEMIALATCAGLRHPTFALWPLVLTDALAEYLQRGGRKVGAFIEQHPHMPVDFPLSGTSDPFFNINRPADLTAARTLASKLA